MNLKAVYTPKFLLFLGLFLTGLIGFIVILDQGDAVIAEKGSPSRMTPLPTPSVTVSVATFTSPENHRCYQYTVNNGSSVPVVGIDIGIDPETDSTELQSLPRGWTVDEHEGGAIHDPNVPSLVEAFTAEESDKFFMTAVAFRANPTENRGFSVCMWGKWDITYKTSHWKAYFMDGTSATGQLIDSGSL